MRPQADSSKSNLASSAEIGRSRRRNDAAACQGTTFSSGPKPRVLLTIMVGAQHRQSAVKVSSGVCYRLYTTDTELFLKLYLASSAEIGRA